MRIPRTRGAVSGLLLMILGAWGALVPFIGPYFDVSIGTDSTWDWSNGRLWLSIIPGVVAFIGGLWLMTSAHRANASLGAWMGILSGAWFVVGPSVSRLWNDGAVAVGNPIGGTNRQVLEILVSYYALGAAIIALGAFALGRLAVRSVRDVELAEAEAAERERAARFDREDEVARREPVAAREQAAVTREDDVTTRQPVATREDDVPTREPVAQRETIVTREPVADPGTTRDDATVTREPPGGRS
jgi:hypothetical protein